MMLGKLPVLGGGGVGWCDGAGLNFQCRGVLLYLDYSRPTAFGVRAGGGCLDILFSRLLFLFSLFLWETARYRLKYCLK